ncbi:MAG: glycosyltransferase [Fervidicoccaceae archaeon]
MRKSQKISIVIPTYNESGNMLPLFSRIRESLADREYEIVVVDDNSPDDTARAAIEAAEKLGIEDRVKVIVRRGERGLSTAVVRGMEASTGDIIVVMDADLQHPPEMIESLVVPLLEDKAEVSVGVRKGKGYKGLSIPRRLVSKSASIISKILLPQTRGMSDPMSGFFAIKREVFLRSSDSLNPKGFKILLELIVKGKVPSEKITEVEFTFEKRQWGKSKLNSKEVLNFLWHLLNLNEFRILKFIIVGISGIFVNEGILWLLYYKAKINLEISAALGIESSILSNFTLNSFITFRKRGESRILKRVLKYHLSTAIGVFVNYVTIILLTRLFGIEALLSNLVGVLLGFIFNYTLSEHFVWKERLEGEKDE